MSTSAANWLDQVLAVPTAGIQISPNFKAAGQLLSALGPVMDSVFRDDGEINVESSSLLDLKFRSKGGFTYSISATDIVVTFNYPIRPKKGAGTLPAYEPGAIQPYTSLLEKVLRRLEEIPVALNPTESMEIRRIGVVAATRIARESIPPGLELLIDHLGKPWETPLTKISSLLLATLSDRDGVLERCHHTVSFDDSQVPKEVEFTLDWQRLFSTGVRYDSRRFDSMLKECRESALAYFQKVGEGNLKYADQ